MSNEVEVEFEGKRYTATYSVESNVVTVNSFYGSRKTLLGGSSPEVIAGTLLRELLRAAKTSGELKP